MESTAITTRGLRHEAECRSLYAARCRERAWKTLNDEPRNENRDGPSSGSEKQPYKLQLEP